MTNKLNVITEVKYGELDKHDEILMNNFTSKVEKSFNGIKIDSIVFTLYKDIYPLQAVINFEDSQYTSYNLYKKDLEIHNTGYRCSNLILNISKTNIIKDSAL